MREKDVNLPCRIFAILVMLFLLAPLVVIVIASFTPTALITFPPQGFSLKWYANIFGSSTHFMDGLVNSLKIGILATAADILLGVTAALSVCRYSFKGKDALLNYYTSPMYVPSVAFAFVLLQVYSQIGGVSGMLRIFIGHLIIILPYIVGTRCLYSMCSTGRWRMRLPPWEPPLFRCSSRSPFPWPGPASWPVRCWLFCIPLTRWP